MSKRNQKIIKSKIEVNLSQIVKDELGKKKFAKSISSFAQDLSKKIDKRSKKRIKNKAAKVWKA